MLKDEPFFDRLEQLAKDRAGFWHVGKPTFGVIFEKLRKIGGGKSPLALFTTHDNVICRY